MLTKSEMNIFVALQAVGLFQILFALVFLHAVMSSGESAVYDSIRQDDALRERVRKWHRENEDFAIHSMATCGGITLLLGTAGYVWGKKSRFVAQPRRDDAPP